jgi:hypothetical protein
MTRPSAKTARPRAAEWTTVLTQELSRRFSRLASEVAAQAVDPLLKPVVITDAEVSALLAPPTEVTHRFTAGSLLQSVVDEAERSSSHLLELQQRFALNAFEMDCLLVCLAAEVAPRFERVFAYLNDAITARLPGADLLLRTVAPGQLASAALLGPDAKLQRYGLLSSVDGGRLGPFRATDGLVRYALRHEGLDAALAQAWCEDEAAPLAARLWDTSADLERLAALVGDHVGSAGGRSVPLVLTLRGRAGSGRRYLFEQACVRAGLGCLSLDVRKIRTPEALLHTLTAAFRDSALRRMAVLLHHADIWAQDRERAAEVKRHLQPLVRELGSVVAVGVEGDLDLPAWFPTTRVVQVDLVLPDSAARTSAWQAVLEQVGGVPPAARPEIASALGSKFRLTLGEIALGGHRAAGVEVAPTTTTAWADLLHVTACAVATPRLGQLAQAVPLSHTLQDLVLPPDRMAAVREIVRRVRHRGTVLHEWGLNGSSQRGRGLIALFHGASGTGKTMAAEAVASALRMQLYRVDLAGVVSKYIGETEKNLRAIFEEADRADAVVLFDEADALFGRRSDVRDSHDRYANIEINYLLQRIESFDGIAILATNLRGHVDEAFLRRIHITVEFPVPQEGERRGLWDRSFPASAPLGGDVDWTFLARRFELTGGAIRNAALGAAFLAADGSGVIGMAEIVNALHAELIKAGRRVSTEEFGPHACHLRPPPTALSAGDR